MNKAYRLSPSLYLEWFDDEALLLVADSDLLLTINRGAGELFEALAEAFSGRTFTLPDAVVWLGRNYELAAAACRTQARNLLAFALKHRLVAPVPAGED